VTTNEKDYSDYIKHLSNLNSVGSLLAGFTFTTITLLITRLPDPSSIMSQLVLFFIAALFYLFLFLVGWNTNTLIYFCRNVPPKTKQLSTFNLLTVLSYLLLELTVILMFLLWEPNISCIGIRNCMGIAHHLTFHLCSETIPNEALS